jgi:hypothetical protein
VLDIVDARCNHEDEPYFNVAVDKLSFNYRALYWARNTEKFQFTDASVDVL